MHSTDLPVTEWWDPADDVHDVPPCPQGDGRTDATLWTEAFLFSATIGWIWADYDGYWGRWTRQLTTGADVWDITTHDAEHCTICLYLVGPLFHDWDWVEPCSCEYALHQTVWYPTHRIDIPGVGMRGAAYTFRIDPDCHWHGVAALARTYLDVLDEDERRNY